MNTGGQFLGPTLNCVKVDLTLFCLFFETSNIVNSYLAFTSVSVLKKKC